MRHGSGYVRLARLIHLNPNSHLLSSISSKALRTAEITKAEKVQFLPFIASFTLAITSFGNRMVLLVVGGIEGILKFDTLSPRNTIVLLTICSNVNEKSELRLQCRFFIVQSY